jgi:hypothetical protein
MSQLEECLQPKLTAKLLTKELGLPENAANNIEAVLLKDGQHGGGILDCGSFGSVFNYSVMIAVAITGIGACYYDSYPAFKTLTFMLKGGNKQIKFVQNIGRQIGFNFKVSPLIKDATMNAIQSVLSGNSSNLPDWLFNIVKHICEHPAESCEKEIAEIIHKEFGEASDGEASDGKAYGGKASDRKAYGGKASNRKASNRKAINRKMKSKKMKSKKIKYPHKRTRRK